MRIKKSRKTLPLPAEEKRKSIEARFTWAAGTDQLEQHDPLYHVTESFQQKFDRIGISHAASAAAGFAKEREKLPLDNKSEEKRALKRPEKNDPSHAPGGFTAAEVGESGLITEYPSLTKFSEIAFRRGAMSTAVLNGTGKMMLVSCLKRTARELGPKHLQQHRLSERESFSRVVPGHSPDQLVFNRGFTDSALGIVVDTLKDARRVVESMAEIARGPNEGQEGNFSALYKIYPFLDDSRDAALESEYRAKLAECSDEREKPILQNALVKTLSLRAKKAQMKNEFINKLRFISDRATETLAELEAEGAAEEIGAEAFGEEAPELPENPPENPDEGAEDDAPNGKKDGAGKAARRRAQTRP